MVVVEEGVVAPPRSHARGEQAAPAAREARTVRTVQAAEVAVVAVVSHRWRLD